VSNRTIDPPVKIGANLLAIAVEENDLSIRSGTNEPVALGSFLAHTHGGEGWELEIPTIRHLLGDAIAIENKDRFPNATWKEIPPRIGTVGEEALYLLGTEEDDEVLVGKINLADDEAETPSFFATPLGELLSHSSEKISIPSPLPN
jgi:hypothetical protein